MLSKIFSHFLFTTDEDRLVDGVKSITDTEIHGRGLQKVPCTCNYLSPSLCHEHSPDYTAVGSDKPVVAFCLELPSICHRIFCQAPAGQGIPYSYNKSFV